MKEITGDESPTDILRISLEWFSSKMGFKERHINTEIIYQNNIPYLILQARVKDDAGEFVCRYRLDRMMLRIFPECERLYNEIAEDDILDERDDKVRRRIIRHLARYAMTTMLSHLTMLQMIMFEENFNDMKFLTASTLFDSLAHALQPGGEAVKKEANIRVRNLLDETIDDRAKKKRRILVELLNGLPSLQIPVGVGRPQGSTKPAEKKAQEAAEFEKKIEETIRSLLSSTGEMPTKTAVAKALGIGGLNPATGIDSSLQSFNGKLKRLGVDYDAIVERIRLNK